jgi:hypothetical protein
LWLLVHLPNVSIIQGQKRNQSKKRAKKVAGATSRGKRKPATESGPKQIATKSPEESIRMEPATETIQINMQRANKQREKMP